MVSRVCSELGCLTKVDDVLDHVTHRAIPHSRFETLPRAAHFPHLEDPEGLAAVLNDFLRTTQPGRIDDGDWGRLIAPHSPRSRVLARAA